jgi:hypothetical protein
VTQIKKRPVTPPRDPANRTSIEQLKTAVEELGGVVGDPGQRAVRLCELVDAGIVKVMPDGKLAKAD